MEANFSTFVPHKVIKTVDGQTIILQDLDQDLERHQVGVVANQGRRTLATASSPTINKDLSFRWADPRVEPIGIAATPDNKHSANRGGDNGVVALVEAHNQSLTVEQSPKVDMPTMLAGLTSEDEPCFVNSKQYKR